MPTSSIYLVATGQMGRPSLQVLYDRFAGPASGREDGTQAASIRATISAICGSNQELQIEALDRPFTLLPSAIDVQTLSPSLQDYLKQLTLYANAAAASLACGSILAGQTSETDEYGDIALWLGDGEYGQGHELDVLTALGLDSMAVQAGRVQEVKLSVETGLPATAAVAPTPGAEILKLRELLLRLTDVRAFYVSGDPHIYLLLGRFNEGSQSGWAGLLGLGVQS